MSTLVIEITDCLDINASPSRQFKIASHTRSDKDHSGGFETFQRQVRLDNQISELVEEFYTLEYYHAKDKKRKKTNNINRKEENRL